MILREKVPGNLGLSSMEATKTMGDCLFGFP